MPDPSFDQAPASQAEKYILQRAAPHQDGLGPKSAAVHRGRRPLTVGGVEQGAIWQWLHALRQGGEPIERRRAIDRKAKREHLPARVLVDQASRRSKGADLRLIHDDQPITE